MDRFRHTHKSTGCCCGSPTSPMGGCLWRTNTQTDKQTPCLFWYIGFQTFETKCKQVTRGYATPTKPNALLSSIVYTIMLQHLCVNNIASVHTNRCIFMSILPPICNQQFHPLRAPNARHGHIQLAMCKYRLGQKNADHLQCLPLRLIDGHGKCRAHRELVTAQSERHSFCVWRCDA